MFNNNADTKSMMEPKIKAFETCSIGNHCVMSKSLCYDKEVECSPFNLKAFSFCQQVPLRPVHHHNLVRTCR